MAAKSLGITELDFERGNVAENWKQWKQTMELTLQGPLGEKDEKRQCMWLFFAVYWAKRERYLQYI